MPIQSYFKATIFWKILGWFWLTFFLVFLVTFFFAEKNNDRIRYQETPQHLDQQIDDSLIRIAKYLAIDEYRNRDTHPTFPHFFVIGPDNKDLFGKPLPTGMLELDKYVATVKTNMSVIDKEKILYGGTRFVDRNTEYRVYIRRIISYLSNDYMTAFYKESAVYIIASTFFVSFPLSFLMAWLVVRPIKKLRHSTREVSLDVKNRSGIESLHNRNDEFGDLAQDFSSMVEQIEQQLTARSRLISDVSHELRSPLTRMQIAIGLANKKYNKDGDIAELGRIKLEADRMNWMLTELLDLSRLDTLSSPQDRVKINLNRLIDNIVSDAIFEAEQTNIQLYTTHHDDVEIYGNRSGLISCIENIIRNAIRFAKTSIKIEVEKSQIADFATITIQDDGNGIPESETEKIFNAFHRPDEDRSRQSGGVGLGLAIAKKAIDIHQGNISAKNAKPHGLIVTIHLPL